MKDGIKIRVGYRYFKEHRLSTGPMMRYSAFYFSGDENTDIRRLLLLDLRTDAAENLEKLTFNWTFFPVGMSIPQSFKMLSKRHSVSRGFIGIINKYIHEPLRFTATLNAACDRDYDDFYTNFLAVSTVFGARDAHDITTIKRTIKNCIHHSMNTKEFIGYNGRALPTTIKFYEDASNLRKIQNYITE